MKKLFTLFIVAMLSSFAFVGSSFAEIEPTGRSTSFDNTGAVQAGSVEKRFIVVKNTNGAALVAGNIVVPDTTEDDGYSVATSSTVGESPLCVITEACAAGAVCKNCQTWGPGSVLFDAGSTSGGDAAVAGQPVYLATTNAGYASGFLTVPTGADGFIQKIGSFLDAATASGSVEVFIQL